MLIFEPIYQERVWGGRGLEEALGRTLPSDGRIGESWEMVDRDEANSVVSRGPKAGQRLRDLLEGDPEGLMGPGWDGAKRFPILVKWLDCQERLSLQVHPPASVADDLGGEPKTENWYVVASRDDAALLAGLKQGVTQQQFEEALRAEELEPLVHRMPTRAGDSLFVPSGRIHAIDAGNLILEIQQNSDTTYRVYDWGRTGLDGKPRQLHVEESMQSIDFQDFEPDLLRPEGAESVLADADEFRLVRRQLQPGERLAFPSGEMPRILSVVNGRLREKESGEELRRGDNALLPYAASHAFVVADDAPATVLITSNFA